MLPKTAKEALSKGETRYFTGKPCKHGHLVARIALTRACVTCQARSSHEMRKRRLPYFLEINRQRQDKRRPQINDYARARYTENKKAVRLATEKWRIANKARDAAKTARRKALKLRACPSWVDYKEIEAFYIEARRLTAETGIPHEVDHKHPLQGKTLCVMSPGIYRY